MSRRPTKPQLRRRSGLSLRPPPPTGSISLCLSRGASCPLLARGVPVPPHSRGPKARAGPTSRSPAWGPAPGCSGVSGRSVWLWGAGSVEDRPSSPCLLDAALDPSRRWRAIPVAARRASASAVFVFAIHAPHSPAEHGARSVRPSPLRRRRPPPDVTGHSSLPGTGAPRRRREKNVGA